ncbi:MAG: acetate--CoA ligase family protein, partial [Deltaproteobacteria bacterium]|nr:acetate--CoA ligase family protein [Deltaproteobacteria bacterium]
LDIDAIADVLVKVSTLATDLEDTVAELDINPLLVLPEGEGVWVADALVIKK